MAEPTDITVRVLSKDAKFVGTSMGGVRITLRDAETGEPSPYVMVRRGLEALVDRKSFYRLVDLGEVATVDGTDWFGLHSGGAFFPIIPAADLPD